MPLYEHTIIARGDLTGQQAETLAETYKTLIEEMGGSVSKTEYWGLRTLSYRINKNRKGHYLHLNLDAPADAVLEMERRQRLNEDIIRLMTIKVDALDPNPSAVLQSRNERGDRSDRGPRRDRGDRPERGERRDRDDRPPRENREDRPPREERT